MNFHYHMIRFLSMQFDHVVATLSWWPVYKTRLTRRLPYIFLPLSPLFFVTCKFYLLIAPIPGGHDGLGGGGVRHRDRCPHRLRATRPTAAAARARARRARGREFRGRWWPPSPRPQPPVSIPSQKNVSDQGTWAEMAPGDRAPGVPLKSNDCARKIVTSRSKS